MEDVNFINDDCLDDANAKMDFRLRVEGGEELLADFLGEFFGIIEALERFRQTRLHPLGWQHYRCRHHRAGKWATTGFVHSSQSN